MKRRFCVSLVSILVCSISAYAEHAGSDKNADSWILTQYYGGGSVGMFYSIINQADSTLILIDGGWTENAEQVKSVIDNNGYVDYWILTHYHEDHCGSFNALWPECRDKIGTVYITPLTWEELEPYCMDWDTPDTFRLFLAQTEGDEKIIPLHRGDKFGIGSLQLTVFNAWDNEILPVTKDVANNCSLVFKVEGQESSILFLGDMTASGLAQLLMNEYSAEELYADYVQAGHHGWGQYGMSLYANLQPKEIFIYATDELLNDDYYADKHGVLTRWCQANGIPIHTYNGTPYSICFE